MEDERGARSIPEGCPKDSTRAEGREIRKQRKDRIKEEAMARAKLSPILESVRGAMGDMVWKQYRSRVVVSRKPGG